MKQLQSFYHAFYELLYAQGRGEGEVSLQFKKNLRHILKQEFGEQEHLIDFVIQGDTMDAKIAGMWAMRELKKSTVYLGDQERSKVLRVLHSFLEQHPEAIPAMNELKLELGDR